MNKTNKTMKPMTKKSTNIRTEKIYCYVDETGQDTKGWLFITVSIIIENEKIPLEIFLEACEAKSGCHKRKWLKTRNKEKTKYIGLVLSSALFKEKIYFRKYDQGRDYVQMAADAIVGAIEAYAERRMLGKTAVIIIIDGLNSVEKATISRIIRKNGIFVDKIRGMRDQSSSLIRLADTVAGIVRDAEEGNAKLQTVVNELEQKGVISEI